MHIRKFNIFLFLSTFFRSLVDIFVPIILYKSKFTYLDIMYFMLLKSSISFIINPIICILAERIEAKYINLISIVFFYIGYSYLFNGNMSILIIALFMAIYENTFIITRHYYCLNLIDNNNNIAFISRVYQRKCMRLIIIKTSIWLVKIIIILYTLW